MADKSGIEWTDATWNLIVGCSVVSPGCTNCYAMKDAARMEAIAGAHAVKHGGDPGPMHRYLGTTQKTGKGKSVWTGKVAFVPEVLEHPLRWRRPRRIFVNSMSDLFHESVPDAWIDQIFAVMALCPQHTFQVLTKRPQRMQKYFAGFTDDDGKRYDGEGWRDALIEGEAQALYARLHPGEDPSAWLAVHMPLPNVWLGTSVEDQRRADERIPHLLQTPAAIRFLSVEPLLGPVDLLRVAMPEIRYETGIHYHDVLRAGSWSSKPFFRPSQPDEPQTFFTNHSDTNRLDWVIVGGESGPGARPMHPDWARSLRDQCATAGVPFFFKQWGKWAVHEIGPDGEITPGMPPKGIKKLQFWSGASFVRPGPTTMAAEVFAPGRVIVTPVGKHAAGRLLDGVEHNAMPERA